MKKIIIIVLGVLVLSSCQKAFERINTNPNAAESSNPGLLFSGATVNLAATRAGGDVYVSMALAAQTIASGGDFGWGADDIYAISPFSTGNAWRGYFVNMGANLMESIKSAEQSNSLGAAGQSRTLLAEAMYEATMLFGDIPFSEAWNPDVAYPKFDSQEDVLDGILTLLDEAIDNFNDANASATVITNLDLIYGGNVAKWKAAAKSLKFRILMTMVDKVPDKKADIAALYSEGGMITSADGNMKIPFGTTTGTRNPRYQILETYAGGTNLFFFANDLVINPMIADNDPRISHYFDIAPKGTTYVGVETEHEADTTTSPISMQLYAQDAPEYLMTYQELLFLQAIAIQKGYISGGQSDAQIKYQEAIKQSCLMNGVNDGDASAFASSKTLGSNALSNLYLQAWIDLMDRPIEAFNTWRLSGTKGNEVPALQIPRGAPNNGLFYRWEYPLDNEINPNQNAPKDKINYYDQEWFDL